MSGQGIRLFGIIESLWLMAASCWPSHVAKSASQTSVASSINGRFFRTSISQDVLNLTILLKQISITLSRVIRITGRVLTPEYLILRYFGWGSEMRNVLTGVIQAEAPWNGGHSWAETAEMAQYRRLI